MRWSCALIVTLALPAATLADGLDIGIRNVGGTIGTVGVTGEPPTQDFGTSELRVFGVDLTYDVLDDIVKAEEPGLASNDGSVLGRSLRVDILAAAREWNGSSFVPTTWTLRTGKFPGFPFVNTPATDTTVAGSPFIVSDDFHFDWILNSATATTGTGIYLVEARLVDTSSTGALLPSAPYWMVFNYGLSEEEHDEAQDWVSVNLVPAPGAAGLLAGLGVIAGRRRRR
jgi:hypothetical protein